MRIWFVLLATSLSFVSSLGSSHETELVGCPDPDLLAVSLTKIEKSDWQNLSVERVMSDWPVQFDELVCEGAPPCRILVSKERVIKGHCECCEAFVFNVESDKGGKPKEKLVDVIIHYSSSNREDLLRDAMKILRGTGLPEAKIRLLGHETAQRSEWESVNGEATLNNLLETKITKVGTSWELWASLSR
jgi:hypothetical protein